MSSRCSTPWSFHACFSSATIGARTRASLLRELLPTLAGRYRDQRLRTRTLLLFGADDGVVRPPQIRGYEGHADEMSVELIPGVGHFTPEEAPDLVADRTMNHFESAPLAPNKVK